MFGPRWAGHRFATFELPQWLPDWWGFFWFRLLRGENWKEKYEIGKNQFAGQQNVFGSFENKPGMSRFKQYLQLMSQGFCLSYPVSSLPEDLTSADGKISS